MAIFSELWRNRPLFKIIIDELARHGGTITDPELYQSIKSNYGFEISKAELLKALLTLEIRGYIAVNKIRKEYHISFSRSFISGKI